MTGYFKNFSFILILFAIYLNSCKTEFNELLVEAESFNNKGGWIVDPQFVEQMGSPYLMAHGLGIPVNNAFTDLTIKQFGIYHIWARTINWAAGNWQAPGRFNILVNNQKLKNTLGTNDGWRWQYAGKIRINKPDVKIELEDLSGFNGRCDAIYFSTKKKSPPEDKEELAKFRDNSSPPENTKEFDLVIVGGGIAGCAASVAAAEQGMNVALIHDRPILGGNASSEIRVHTEGITWQSDRILSMLNTIHWPNGSALSKKDDVKRHKFISQYKNIKLFLNYRAYSTNTDSEFITSVEARHTSTGERILFNAPLFIDCTGDGWIGYWSGAEYMYGRESSEKYNEGLEEHGELWSPEEPDNKVMGASVLWLSETTENPAVFPEVPWAMDVAGEYSATEGSWKWEYSNNDYHQIKDAEKIRDHMLKAIFSSFYNAKQKQENSKLNLQWVSYLIGKRESRRLTGDYIYTFGDMKEMREFDDAVVMEKRAVDVHYQQNLKNSGKPDFLSEAIFYEIDHYYIPYRTLYSKNIKNLLMAGRCFSCSHIGLGGPRVMNTTGQMGIAVGYAASLCKKHNTLPRDIYQSYIEELKSLIENQ
ncbi:FAD-dependent oxidoreductase [Bacteroidota bacterium]